MQVKSHSQNLLHSKSRVNRVGMGCSSLDASDHSKWSRYRIKYFTRGPPILLYNG